MSQTHYTNTSPQDVIVDVKIDGSNLEETKKLIENIAPQLGFEVESAEIRGKDESPVSDVEELIKKEVSEQLNKSLSQMNLSQISDEPKVFVPSTDSIHRGITCDICSMNPIIGIRYKSLIREDYDLCENCEKENDVDHPMIRMRVPHPVSYTHLTLPTIYSV